MHRNDHSPNNSSAKQWPHGLMSLCSSRGICLCNLNIRHLHTCFVSSAVFLPREMKYRLSSPATTFCICVADTMLSRWSDFQYGDREARWYVLMFDNNIPSQIRTTGLMVLHVEIEYS